MADLKIETTNKVKKKASLLGMMMGVKEEKVEKKRPFSYSHELLLIKDTERWQKKHGLVQH